MTKKEERQKIKNERKENIIVFLERFPFWRYAASANGISEDTLQRWRDDDPIFAERCEASRIRGLIMYAKKASPDFMLACAEPEVFGKNGILRNEDRKPLVIIKDGNTTIEVAN